MKTMIMFVMVSMTMACGAQVEEQEDSRDAYIQELEQELAATRTDLAKIDQDRMECVAAYAVVQDTCFDRCQEGIQAACAENPGCDECQNP